MNMQDEYDPTLRNPQSEHALEEDLTGKYARIEAERTQDLHAALGMVGVRAETLASAKLDLDISVAAARAVGATWASIAEAVGITQQAAHRRWDAGARQRHAEYQRNKNKQRKAQ